MLEAVDESKEAQGRKERIDMKRIERVLMVLAAVVLMFCWVGMPGCTTIFAWQWNKHDKNKSRQVLPADPVAPDGSVEQKNRMEISVSWMPQLGLEVSGAKPSLGVESAAPATADVKKETGDKDKPTTWTAAEAARGEPRKVD